MKVKDSRIQGVKDSSEIFLWKIKEAEIIPKVLLKSPLKTLEPLIPGTLDPSIMSRLDAFVQRKILCLNPNHSCYNYG